MSQRNFIISTNIVHGIIQANTLITRYLKRLLVKCAVWEDDVLGSGYLIDHKILVVVGQSKCDARMNFISFRRYLIVHKELRKVFLARV